MTNVFRWLSVSVVVLLCPVPLTATWSLGVIDPQSLTIAVAGASCTASVYGIAGVVPGVGFVFAQAASNMKAKAKALDDMRRGTPVHTILRRIANHGFDTGFARQQYAILTVAEIGRPATFTGNDTPEWHGVRAGRAISVQGNTLASPAVLQTAFDSLHRARWTDDAGLARAALEALAAGSLAGGDRRCGAITSSSAFLTVVRAHDRAEMPYLNLVVRRSDAQGRNAVTVLRQRLEAAQAAR